MKTNLNRTITNEKEAIEFLIELHNNGESFHPEDNAHDIAWSLVVEPKYYECCSLNHLMGLIYANTDIDPCDILLYLHNDAEAEEQIKTKYNI
jgi:hypothetical protein